MSAERTCTAKIALCSIASRARIVVALLPDRSLHLVDSGGDLPELGRTLGCELGVLTSTDAAYGGGERREGDHQPAADEERRDRGHDERHPDGQHEGPRRGDPARVDRRLDVLEPHVDRAVELVEAVADDVEASLRSARLDERIGQLRVARGTASISRSASPRHSATACSTPESGSG